MKAAYAVASQMKDPKTGEWRSITRYTDGTYSFDDEHEPTYFRDGKVEKKKSVPPQLLMEALKRKMAKPKVETIPWKGGKPRVQKAPYMGGKLKSALL